MSGKEEFLFNLID